ncbi:MAG: prepilin-type N-terminal cleavage/methylation domain-containing protein [Phycisphaerae bacterium]|jgi:prepilin-type N-terminal cleavage/methylation domain-containing protein|nr:prepilin-type N-terminal cleavage/methylation domain-containing protein [Phycisphaerae bacterium]
MTQKTAKYRYRTSQTPPRRRAKGFTLIELAVALTIILMMITMVVPTLSKMLSSRASMEAFNLVAAQLTAARAEAITGNTYAGIHVQLGAQPDMRETAYSMIIGLTEDEVLKDDPKFTRQGTFLPQELPGGTALGQLTADFVEDKPPSSPDPDNPDDSGVYKNIGSDTQLKRFCAFSIIFSPDGSVAQRVKSANVLFNVSDPMFNGDTQLWDFNLANDKPGVTAFTIFDYKKVLKLESSDRITYLNENGQFLPVNMHTGQLFDRQ